MEVTNRTFQGRYLLLPTAEVRTLVLGALGRAQRRFQMPIHAFTFASNHFHLLLTPRDAEHLADFMELFESTLAREVSRLHDWSGSLWDDRYRSIPIEADGELNTPEDRRKRQSTANRALAVFKAALNMAHREGKVASDDTWRRVKPFKGVDRPKVRFLEADEALRLMNACDPDFRRIVHGALLTGCRYGELCALRVGDFKATPMPLIQLEDSKSGKGRHVYLNEEGAAFFGAQAAGRPEAEPLFLRAEGEPWGRSHQARRMKDASRSAEIDPPATFHELRHTYASHYLMNGGNLAGLAQQLGTADASGVSSAAR
jgi:integrase